MHVSSDLKVDDAIIDRRVSDAQLFRQLFLEFSRLSSLIRLRTMNLFEPLDSPLLALGCASVDLFQEPAKQGLAVVGTPELPSSADTQQLESVDAH